jgi:hypothetical protein
LITYELGHWNGTVLNVAHGHGWHHRDLHQEFMNVLFNLQLHTGPCTNLTSLQQQHQRNISLGIIFKRIKAFLKDLRVEELIYAKKKSTKESLAFLFGVCCKRPFEFRAVGKLEMHECCEGVFAKYQSLRFHAPRVLCLSSRDLCLRLGLLGVLRLVHPSRF